MKLRDKYPRIFMFIWQFCLGYGLLCGFMYLFQRNLVFYPNKNMQQPAAYGLNEFEEIILTAEDAVSFKIWYREPKNNAKTILYFHGNGGNLGGRSNKVKAFAENSDYGLLFVSYRGYGGSGGRPSERGLYLDADAAMAFLAKQGLVPEDLIIYGESLGSAVAVELASKIQSCAGLILESPFTSAVAVGQKSYFYLPVSLLMKDRFDSISKINEFKGPMLVFHGNRDRVVPFKFGKQLYEAYLSNKKEFIEIDGVGHLGFDDVWLIEQIKEFLAEKK